MTEPEPLRLAWAVLCVDVTVDRTTLKKTLHHVYTATMAETFPKVVPVVTIVGALVAEPGLSLQLRAVLVRPDDSFSVSDAGQLVVDPGGLQSFTVRVPSAEYRSAGRHWWVIATKDNFELGRTPLDVYVGLPGGGFLENAQ